jgi:hypothetical protein
LPQGVAFPSSAATGQARDGTAVLVVKATSATRPNASNVAKFSRGLPQWESDGGRSAVLEMLLDAP